MTMAIRAGGSCVYAADKSVAKENVIRRKNFDTAEIIMFDCLM
jgi:hypothetical protein